MPDGNLSKLESLYNKLVGSGTGALRDLNVRRQGQSALAEAIRTFLKKPAGAGPDAEQYIDELSNALAKAIVEIEPIDQTFGAAKNVLVALAGYLEERLLIPVRMHEAAETLAGRSIHPSQLAAVQGTVSANAMVARTLDDKLAQRVKHEFSFRPGLALDPTVKYVQKVDAGYSVTITKLDATVRLHSAFALERPLTSRANLNTTLGAELSPRPGLMGYVKGSAQFEDIYGRPQLTGSLLSAGVAATLAPRATLNLDYNAKNLLGGQGVPEHSVFLGIKIRF